MKPIITVFSLCMVFLVGGCAPIDVGYDYDPEIDFSRFRAYDWIPVPKNAKIDELTMKHIKRSIGKEMERKGYTQKQDKADFLIAIHSSKEKKVDMYEWGYTYGRHGYYWGDPYWGSRYPRRHYYRKPYWGPGYYGYERRFDRYEYEVGTLTIDIVDVTTKELIWRGRASMIMDPYEMTDPEDRRSVIDKMVVKILKTFPP